MPGRMPLDTYVDRTLGVIPLVEAYLGETTIEAYAQQLFSAPEQLLLTDLTHNCIAVGVCCTTLAVPGGTGCWAGI